MTPEQKELFDKTLERLLGADKGTGFVSYVPQEVATDPAGGVPSLCWFSSARNAASWVATQDPERFGTEFEYVVEVADAMPIF